MSVDADILIVDDQTADLRSLSDLLEKEGYKVRPVENDRSTIDSALLKTPDLIILNSHMSGMDGFEVCQHLKQKKQTEHIPKIFISALNDTETRIRGFEAGCVDFISKPFQEQEVLARVNTQLGLHKMKQNLEKLVEERTAELSKYEATLEQKISALQESQERFRLVFDNAIEGIAIAQGEVLKYCNPQMTDLTGYSKEEVLNMNFLIFVHPDDLEMVKGEYQMRLSGEKPKSTYPVRLITKQGKERYVLVNSTLIDWEGQPATLVLLSDISSLKDVESDLKSIKERYELAVSGSDAGIWDWDMVKDEIYFSDQFKNLLGYGDKDWSVVSLQDYRELVHPEDVESADKKLSEYLTQGKGKFNNVYRLQTKSGQYRWFEISGRAIRDENGIPIRGSGSLVDIHERKLAEEELRISEQRYELAVSGSEVGIWEYNFKTDKSYYSDRFKELMGYDPRELKNLTLEEATSHLHPDFPEKLQIALQDHLEGNAPFYFIDYKVRMKSGEYRWFQARGKAAWDDQGKPDRVAGSFVDIHEQKIAEEKIKRSERHFRHLMESTPLAVAIFSPEGNINQVNDAWKNLWGLSEQETTQLIAEYNLINDKQLEELGVLTLVKRAFEGESIILPPITYQGNTTTTKLGLEEIESQSRTIQIHMHSVKNANGDMEYVVAINMDLTKLKQAEAEVESQRESLARMDRTSSMGQLTGSIAHELNQPLTGILSNAQAAEMLINNESWTTEDLREIMSAIVSDTKRASSVIRNLREMYRDHTTESFPFEMNGIASQTLQLLNSELVTNNIHLATNFDPTVPKAEGNVVQIQQVLVNLIMNSMQAMTHVEKADRQLYIATESEENEIKVWVKDHGPGIDSDKIDHIFEPFATWRAGGTGMGLAISNSIITAHGGSMVAENLEGGGCRVGFILPVSNEDNNT